MNNKQIFMNELIRISGVSKIYADAAWFTLMDDDREKPIEQARWYMNRFNMNFQANEILSL